MDTEDRQPAAMAADSRADTVATLIVILALVAGAIVWVAY